MRILVTGATGYIGGRLIPRLIAAGDDVRVLVRDASRIAGRPWLPSVEVAVGDILDRGSLERALAGVDTAYYLVHSMMTAGFQELDRRAAETFVAACPAALRKIIYLGGLLPEGEQRSKHLRSRAEVGTILRASSLPVLGSARGRLRNEARPDSHLLPPRTLWSALLVRAYALYPLHARIFSDLARVIAKEAEG